MTSLIKDKQNDMDKENEESRYYSLYDYKENLESNQTLAQNKSETNQLEPKEKRTLKKILKK